MQITTSIFIDYREQLVDSSVSLMLRYEINWRMHSTTFFYYYEDYRKYSVWLECCGVGIFHSPVSLRGLTMLSSQHIVNSGYNSLLLLWLKHMTVYQPQNQHVEQELKEHDWLPNDKGRMITR